MSQREHGAKTALIVEDSPTQAMKLERLLSENGLVTIWAHDGDEGLRCAQSLRPDVIIMDVFMPGGMNGLQLSQCLKESKRTRDIPIIVLTQYNSKESAKFGLQMGAVEYIPKDAFADAVLLETLKAQGLIEG